MLVVVRAASVRATDRLPALCALSYRDHRDDAFAGCFCEVCAIPKFVNKTRLLAGVNPGKSLMSGTTTERSIKMSAHDIKMTDRSPNVNMSLETPRNFHGPATAQFVLPLEQDRTVEFNALPRLVALRTPGFPSRHPRHTPGHSAPALKDRCLAARSEGRNHALAPGGRRATKD